ncbi:MAG TPA: hypothetical protein VGO84_08010, partial [Burkholderiales bacterium]|nr:hypothetical protein [Burkholderiales bacterium]
MPVEMSIQNAEGRKMRPTNIDWSCSISGGDNMKITWFVSCGLLALSAAVNAQDQSMDWKKVDAAMGRNATVSGEVHRYGFPRS